MTRGLEKERAREQGTRGELWGRKEKGDRADDTSAAVKKNEGVAMLVGRPTNNQLKVAKILNSQRRHRHHQRDHLVQDPPRIRA